MAYYEMLIEHWVYAFLNWKKCHRNEDIIRAMHYEQMMITTEDEMKKLVPTEEVKVYTDLFFNN
jgi:hypothetical protein